LFGWNVRLPLATTENSCVSSPRITGGARVRRAHAEDPREMPWARQTRIRSWPA
jgi:hypothetical protein